MAYFARRIAFFVLTVWAAVTLNFLIPRLQPGDPAELTHPTKLHLRESFVPADPAWREQVLRRGAEVFERAVREY